MTYTNTQKRKMLTSALFQHSTKLQSFKQSALDRIVERIIYFSESIGLETKDIQGIFKKELGYNLPKSSFENAIKRLFDNNRIENTNSDRAYRLTDISKSEFENIQVTSEKSFNRIINKLFHNAPENRENYIDPFWFSMSYIFSNIGEYSAKLVEGKVDKETVLKPILQNCITELEVNFKINNQYFIKRLEYFFEETKEPLYNEFRWVLAQNYFITSSLGINPDSETFSKELFQDITLYLDTNVILPLLSEHDKHNNNVISFIEAANKLGVNFCVCQITFSEIEGWVNDEADRINIASHQIPSETKSKVGSCIYQKLQEKLRENQVSTTEERQELLNQVIQEYMNYKEVIEKLIPQNKLEYIDNNWFETVENHKDFENTITVVKEKYLEVRGRKKSQKASIHDAKILLWLEKQILENEKDYRFVTLDNSLPLIKLDKAEKSNSIILEAILQWLVPLTNNGDFQEKFSNVLKQKILPKEFLFEVNDFMIFEELHMECSELPSEDVEDCILFLKKNAPNLNPNEPADREKLASHIAKYFIDPGRKYKKELTEKEQENEQLIAKLGDVYQMMEEIREHATTKESELEETRLAHEKELKNIKDEHNQKLDKVLGSLDGVTTELGLMKEEKRQAKIEEKMKIWQKPAKIALVVFCILLLFGVLELMPDWGWNYPAKLLAYFNSLEATDKGSFNICIGLNIFLLSGFIISLFIFFYNRLINKDKIEEKKEHFDIKTL